MTRDENKRAQMRRGEKSLFVLKSQVGAATLGEVLEGEPPEGYSKVGAVERVDERIDGGVDPAEPREVGHHEAVDLVGGQERREQVVDEEGQPAGDEAADHDAQRLGRLGLPAERGHSAGRLEVEHGHVHRERLRPLSVRLRGHVGVHAGGALRRELLHVERVIQT